MSTNVPDDPDGSVPAGYLQLTAPPGEPEVLLPLYSHEEWARRFPEAARVMQARQEQMSMLPEAANAVDEGRDSQAAITAPTLEEVQFASPSGGAVQAQLGQPTLQTDISGSENQVHGSVDPLQSPGSVPIESASS